MDYAWLLLSFKGRINRARLWLALLVILCWMIFLGTLVVIVGSIFGGAKSFSFGVNDIFLIFDPETYRSPSKTDLFPLFAKAIGTPVFLWVYFATSIKRLHDRDKSGWWMVPFFAVPGLYNQFADRLGDSDLIWLPGLVAFVLCIWGFVDMYFLQGSRKTNRFGPNPLQPIDTRPRWDQQREIEMVPHKAGPPPVWHVKRGA
jgi:uncharacterized membrane protein YhaH (DUF805 family)